MFRVVFLSSIISLSSSVALAQKSAYLGLDATYSEKEWKAAGLAAKDTQKRMNFGAGIRFDPGIILGFRYDYAALEEPIFTSREEIIEVGPGITLGFLHSSGFSLLASYLHEPIRYFEDGDGDRVELYGGRGTAFEVAYLHYFSNWGIGPKLSQVERSYSKLKVANEDVELTEDFVIKSLQPYVSLIILF